MTLTEIGTFASILGAFIGASAIVQAVLSNRTVKGLHTETQTTLKTMHTETQTTLRTLGEGQKSLGDILDRMDQAAEARYRDLKDRLDGEAEA
jgi:hypothetical protein